MTSRNARRRNRRSHYLRLIDSAETARARLHAAADLVRATFARADPDLVDRAVEELVRLADDPDVDTCQKGATP